LGLLKTGAKCVDILTEVLKNSFKSVTDRWSETGQLKPVKILMVEGETDISIRISDQGGGIERSRLPLAWSYLHSTVNDPRLQMDLLENRRIRTVLAGYGVGLPLARLYARYFGGDLDIKSLDGYGTDVYLSLPRLGHNCENLPEGVLTSPGEGTSMVERGEKMFFFGSRNTWKENVELGQAPPFVSTDGNDIRSS